jgi:hypothetical protein
MDNKFSGGSELPIPSLEEKKDKIERLYLAEGFDHWINEIRNYRVFEYYYQEKFGKEYDPFRDDGKEKSLKEQLYGQIIYGRSSVFHQDMKDMSALNNYFFDPLKVECQKLQESFPGFPEFDNDKFLQALDNLSDRSERKVRRKISGNFEMHDYHPLLKPFEQRITELEKKEVAKLPEDLATQAKLAGISSTCEDDWNLYEEQVKDVIRFEKDVQLFCDENNMEIPDKIIPLIKRADATCKGFHFSGRKLREYEIHGTIDHEEYEETKNMIEELEKKQRIEIAERWESIRKTKSEK